MISKILPKTKGKPCSCPTGKICNGCKSKKFIKPQVFIEEPRRLTVPIVISHYREKPIKIQALQIRNWNPLHRKQSPKETPEKPRNICQWYKRYKALRELESENKKEEKERQEKLKREKAREREAEVLKQLHQKLEYKEKQEKQERERARREEEILSQLQKKLEYKEKQKLERERVRREEEVLAQLQQQWEHKEKQEKLEREKLRKEEERLKSISLSPTKTEKKSQKAKSANARRRAESRHVSVKRHNRYETFSYRFVNCCYRFCCQLYCWLTLIFIVGLVMLIV